jgi:hypothetical protein
MDYLTHYLYLGTAVLQLINAVVTGTVNITVGVEVNEVAIFMDAQLFPEQLAACRPNTFKVFYGGFE